MAITKDNSRQTPAVAIVDFTFADFVSGTIQAAVDIPQDAVLIGGDLIIDTVFNSGGNDTLTVGDVTVTDRYKAGINGQSLGRTALVPTGFATTNTQKYIGVKWTGTSTAPTTGAGRLIVEYIQNGRADFSQR